MSEPRFTILSKVPVCTVKANLVVIFFFFLKSHTEYFYIKLGVKQGDNLNPILFKLFINGLSKYLEDIPNLIILNDKVVNC